MIDNVKKVTDAALTARKNAYVPYSKFKVGAAILMKDGRLVTGCNIENSSYGLTNCAERTALFTAYAMGYHKDDILMLAIAGNTPNPISPCGACRQVMTELMPLNASVYMVNLKGEIKMMTVSELMPYHFSEADLT